MRVSSTGSYTISVDISVSADGLLRFGAGVVAAVAGMTLGESAREIQRISGPGAGTIGIELLDPLEGSVSFRGAVRRSGSIYIRSPKTLTDVLEIAAPTDSADVNGIVIVGGNGRTFKVDSESQPDFSIRPGDQVIVPQSAVPNEILILGAVKSPGSIPFKSRTTLADAVAQAGGLTGHAVLGEISVLRKNEPVLGADWSETGRRTVLQRGDVVRVASQENGRYVSVLGHVRTSGLVPYREGMTLMEAIQEAGGLDAGAGKDSVEIRKVFGGRGKSKKYDLNLIRKGTPNDPKLEAADVVFVPAFVFRESKPNSGFKPVVPPRSAR